MQFCQGIQDLSHFNLANDISKIGEAICGGEISVLADATPSEHSDRSLSSLNCRSQTAFRQSDHQGDSCSERQRVKINRYWISEIVSPLIPDEFLSRFEPEVRKLIYERNPAGFSGLGDWSPGGERIHVQVFLQPFFPPGRLVIAGAGHIGRALAHLGSLLDFEVTVIDDRSDFANR